MENQIQPIENINKQPESQLEIAKEYGLEQIITNAIAIPGVKVNRDKFLTELFADKVSNLEELLNIGPIQAGCTKESLWQIANKQILIRTSESSAASFLAGLPGGWAMAATIPADVLQFFGMTLRLAQELSYIYGATDLWENGKVDDEKVRNQLIMYCGAMFGVSGAAAGVRLFSSQIAKTALKKLPQQALTKTFWYSIVKHIGKAVGIKVTKSTVAKGVSKIIPVIGGVLSGGLNFASMLPMANRLHKALYESCFNYTEQNMDNDIIEIENLSEESETVQEENNKVAQVKEKFTKGIKDVGKNVSGLFAKKEKISEEDVFVKIEKLAKLKEAGILTQEEFDIKKSELLTRV